MFPGHFMKYLALILVLLAQLWGTGILLLTRQLELLLLMEPMAGVFWAWCLWNAFLNRRRGATVIAGVGLVLTLGCLIPGIVEILTDTELPLVHEVFGVSAPHSPVLHAVTGSAS